MQILGEFEATVTANGKECTANFRVIKGNSGCLLSCTTSRKLGLFQTNLFSAINTLGENTAPEYVGLVKRCSSVFNDFIGKLKGYKVKLHIDHNVQPKQQPYRRVAHHLVKPIEKEINKLIEDGIIERVNKPSDWVSALVSVPKPKKHGEVRITIDSRLANKAIKRVNDVTPTTEEIVYDLNGAKVFSKLDLNKAFHQLELEEDSRSITTFITFMGFFQFKRLHMGVTS